jgi:hypothetical protein
MANADSKQGTWWDSIFDDYENSIISIISVNCTTLNMEFNPNDPQNNNLFDFDPIRYMCYGGGA